MASILYNITLVSLLIVSRSKLKYLLDKKYTLHILEKYFLEAKVESADE